MKIVHVELISQNFTSDGYCEGSMCVRGAEGELIHLLSRVKMPLRENRHEVNAMLAQDAIRQVKRMPEYRKGGVKVDKHAMPRLRRRRIIRLFT